MAIIGWGKPKIEVCKLEGDGTMPSSPVWEEFPTPVEGTTQLTVTKGDKLEAKIEGGENEDVKYKANTYQLVMNIRAAKGRDKPIEDFDGIIKDQYAVRLTPEDAEVPGFVIDRSTVSVEDNWGSEEGGVWVYAFDVLKPATGRQVKWQVINP